MEGKRFFTLHRDSGRRLCEIRWNFESRSPEQRSREEQRLFLQLGPSIVAVNVWLTILAGDLGYSFGTIYEYAKVLLYALTWLTYKPVQLGTAYAVELSLLHLGRADMRALFAWLDIPASNSGARQALCRTGQLPASYRDRRCLRQPGTSVWRHYPRFTNGSLRSICQNMSKQHMPIP